MTYHCPNCGKEVGFGESICPHCKSDVTSMWEQVSSPKKSTPKVTPGLGRMDGDQASPFPAPSSNGNNPFPTPAPANSTPFPSPSGMESSPFPSAPASSDSPFPPAPSIANSPFPSADNGTNEPAPFPPVQDSQPFPSATGTPMQVTTTGPFLEIPRIGGKLYITENPLRIGRDEIQGVATKALPDLNAYKNISRKRADSEHFIIHTLENQYTIEDIHSTNGTYLGTTKLGLGVPPQPLKSGDKIIIPLEEFGKMVSLELFFNLQ